MQKGYKLLCYLVLVWGAKRRMVAWADRVSCLASVPSILTEHRRESRPDNRRPSMLWARALRLSPGLAVKRTLCVRL